MTPLVGTATLVPTQAAYAEADFRKHLSGAVQWTAGKADAVYNELIANVIGNAHMVPSGIVAVGHAQERGYAYAYCG